MAEYNFLTVLNKMCMTPHYGVNLYPNTNIISCGKTKRYGWGRISVAVASNEIEEIKKANLKKQ